MDEYLDAKRKILLGKSASKRDLVKSLVSLLASGYASYYLLNHFNVFSLLLLIVAGIWFLLSFFFVATTISILKSLLRADKDDESRVNYYKVCLKVAAEYKEKNKLVGHLYSVVENKTQNLSLWFVEEEGYWSLFKKFGWWQHKRARPSPSLTHQIEIISKMVVYDPMLHKKLDVENEEKTRDLQRARYNKKFSAENNYVLMLVHDKLEKTVSKYCLEDKYMDHFYRDHPQDQYHSIMEACRNTIGSHEGTVRMYMPSSLN